MKLAGDSVHVWLLDPKALDEQALESRAMELLSVAERDRAARFRFEKDRRLYAAAHALVRVLLSRYGGLPAAAWRFETNEYGRPEIADGQSELPLRFNLSHTAGLAACALSLERDVGVDVEKRVPRHASMDIAAAHFSADELGALRAMAPADQVCGFYRYWTLKEAYIKARGMGLALPLGEFSFSEVDREPIQIRFGAGIEDRPEDWHFLEETPTVDHALALAARLGAASALDVSVREIELAALLGG